MILLLREAQFHHKAGTVLPASQFFALIFQLYPLVG